MRVKSAILIGLLAGILGVPSAQASGDHEPHHTGPVESELPALPDAELPVHDDVGGDFAAQSSLGRKLSLSEFRGKVVLLFFGYTSCPDVCPATLAHLKSLVDRIGPESSRIQVLLVTVDPENDTAERLKQYLARFDDRFIGLTGTQEETDRIASLFMVKHERVHDMKLSTEHNPTPSPVEHSYLYAHSQQIYLLDKQGRTRALYFVGSPIDKMQAAVQTLLNEDVSAVSSGTGSNGEATEDKDGGTR